MSYNISLIDEKGQSVKVDPHEEGGTYALGGIDRAELNVTYNYSKFFFTHIDKEKGIRWLYGKKAEDCIVRLKNAIAGLGTACNKDYWAATPGNAGYALSILLKWAQMHPEAVFEGD